MPLGKFGKIAIGWSVITAIGIYSFVWSKNSVEKHRIESMKVKERMRKSNYGEYTTETQRKFEA